jgi:hypothetical protein
MIETRWRHLWANRGIGLRVQAQTQHSWRAWPRGRRSLAAAPHARATTRRQRITPSTQEELPHAIARRGQTERERGARLFCWRAFHPARVIACVALRRYSNMVLSGGLYRRPRTSWLRNKAVAKTQSVPSSTIASAASAYNCHAAFDGSP